MTIEGSFFELQPPCLIVTDETSVFFFLCLFLEQGFSTLALCCVLGALLCLVEYLAVSLASCPLCAKYTPFPIHIE